MAGCHPSRRLAGDRKWADSTPEPRAAPSPRKAKNTDPFLLPRAPPAAAAAMLNERRTKFWTSDLLFSFPLSLLKASKLLKPKSSLDVRPAVLLSSAYCCCPSPLARSSLVSTAFAFAFLPCLLGVLRSLCYMRCSDAKKSRDFYHEK